MTKIEKGDPLETSKNLRKTKNENFESHSAEKCKRWTLWAF